MNKNRGKTGARILCSIILALSVIVTAPSVSRAETGTSFDISLYSYEELVAIREQVEIRLEEIERENAMKNADRKITFEEPERIVFLKQTTTQLPEVTIIKESAPAKTRLDWSSSDPAIATVTAQGKVTAISAGDAVITATAKDAPYLSASYIVHAAVPVEQITIWGPDEPLLLDGDPEKAFAELEVSIEPEDAYFQDVIWSSSDEATVTVDEHGKITGLRPGQAMITAVSAEDPPARRKAIQATFQISVLQAVTALQCKQKNIIMNAGDIITPEITVMPENASNKTIEYSSSDPEVASADDKGRIHANGQGECDIVCEAADGSGVKLQIHIQVIKLVTGLRTEEKEINIPKGTTKNIEVQVIPEDAAEKGLIWTSSNAFVARVAAGKTEAIGEGDCEITCTTKDGSNISLTIKVHVSADAKE